MYDSNHIIKITAYVTEKEVPSFCRKALLIPLHSTSLFQISYCDKRKYFCCIESEMLVCSAVNLSEHSGLHLYQ